MTDSATSSAIRAFHEIERGRRAGVTHSRIPPIARFGVVVAFLIALISFGRYDLVGVASLTVFPFARICFEGAAPMRGLARYWYVLIPVGLVGAANPFFDRAVVAEVFGMPVTGGWLSFAVLGLKGILAFVVGGSLLRLIGAEGVAQTFASLRLPSSFGLSFLLLHRYLVMMVKEMGRMRDAYLLRSGTKGAALRPSAWGPFVGLLLMRSFDRARMVQEAVALRGGARAALLPTDEGLSSSLCGWLYFGSWCVVFAVLRGCGPMGWFGHLLMGGA